MLKLAHLYQLAPYSARIVTWIFPAYLTNRQSTVSSSCSACYHHIRRWQRIAIVADNWERCIFLKNKLHSADGGVSTSDFFFFGVSWWGDRRRWCTWERDCGREILKFCLELGRNFVFTLLFTRSCLLLLAESLSDVEGPRWSRAFDLKCQMVKQCSWWKSNLSSLINVRRPLAWLWRRRA